MPECTHGGDCPVHPQAGGLHNFAPADVAALQLKVAHLSEQNAKLRDVNRQLGHAEADVARLQRERRELLDERDAARRQLAEIRRAAPVRGLVARLVDAEVRRLDGELAHVRHTRRQALRTAQDQHAENQLLRARVAELEELLLNPNTLPKENTE